MRVLALIGCIGGLLGVAACTDEQLERATVGGALGAAAGEALYDKPVEGAVAGAVLGAVTADETQ